MNTHEQVSGVPTPDVRTLRSWTPLPNLDNVGSSSSYSWHGLQHWARHLHTAAEHCSYKLPKISPGCTSEIRQELVCANAGRQWCREHDDVLNKQQQYLIWHTTVQSRDAAPALTVVLYITLQRRVHIARLFRWCTRTRVPSSVTCAPVRLCASLRQP